MATVFDTDGLKSININGLEAVLLLMNLTIEIVVAVSPPETTDERLASIANRLDDISRGVASPRMQLIFDQLSRGLMAAERPVG